jgi:hypothetical protein
MVVAMGLLTLATARAPGAETAADAITLRDGSIVHGLITSVTTGPRGHLEFVVRRAWAEKTLGKHLQAWDRSTAATRRQASAQRRKRLEDWRRDRAPNVGPDDRVIAWIDAEVARLAAHQGPEPSVLLAVKLSRSDVRALNRRPGPVERLLRLGWLCELPEPESMPVDDLKNSLEARGYAVDAVARQQPAALDRLLPLAPEPEAHWLARRAATELAVDPDLRFLRFQDTLVPDPGAGQPIGGIGLSTAVSELKRMLDLDPGPKTDALTARLKTVRARGRIGAVVTRLEIPPDMSGVTVETALWVCAGQRWFLFGSRSASVRSDDLGQDAGKDLADDPQVQSVFQIAELLGLGAIPADVKNRSLRIGDATKKALETARAAFNQDLNDLALPVLEPVGEVRRAGPGPPDAARDDAPRKPGR